MEGVEFVIENHIELASADAFPSEHGTIADVEEAVVNATAFEEQFGPVPAGLLYRDGDAGITKKLERVGMASALSCRSCGNSNEEALPGQQFTNRADRTSGAAGRVLRQLR